MTIAILKTDGTPIVIDSFTNPVFDYNGFLTAFNTSVKYRYYQVQDFKPEDQTTAAIEGYYPEVKFISYRMEYFTSSNPVSLTDLVNLKYNFKDVLASAGSSVTVNVVDFGDPYEDYWDETLYTFNLETLSDSTVKKYKVAQYDNLELSDYSIPIPTGATEAEQSPEVGSPSKYFYQKNFGDLVDGWSIDDSQKIKFKKTSTLISFQISHIESEIIPLLVTLESLATIDAKADSTVDDLSDLTNLQKAIFILKRSWGYYYVPGSNLVYRKDFDPVFSGSPNYDEYAYYYAGVVYFYQQCYQNSERLQLQLDHLNDPSLPEYTDSIDNVFSPLSYILRFLPVTALGIFPFSIIQSIFSEIIKGRAFSDNTQETIVKLVSAISNTNADPFLDYLLSSDDGAKTNFEEIYSNLSDARLSRIPFVNWFADTQTYKKYFCFAVYQLWIQSKYNFNPPGATDVVNKNCYFLLNPTEFNKNSVLNFPSPISTDPKTGNLVVTSLLSVSSTLNVKQVSVNVVTQIQNQVLVQDQWFTRAELPSTKTYGPFHIYQPITLIGFHANLELNIPTKSTLPAFLFHYITEYDELADFDAKVALAVNLSADVLLAFFTGGESIIADLVYLQYVGGVGEALIGSLPETESVLVWQGVTSASTTISLSAGVLSQINDYLIATETDPARAEILLHNRKLFLGLCLLTGGISALTQSQVISEAGAILNSTTDISYLSQDLQNLLRGIYNENTIITTTFGNKLEPYSNVSQAYQSYAIDIQGAFWKDFPDISASDLERLNSGGSVYMANWLYLHNAGSELASTLDFICDPDLTNWIKRYIDETDNLMDYINQLSYQQKVAFLNTFPPNILSDSNIAFIDSNAPDAMSSLFATLNPPSGLDSFLPGDAITQVNAQFKNSFYKFFVERTLLSANQAGETFLQNITNTVLDLSDLKNLYNNKIINACGLTDPRAIKRLSGANQLFSNTSIFKNGQPVQISIEEIFISGDQDAMSIIFPSGVPKEIITDPANYDNYDAFAIKAWDPTVVPDGRFRTYDTEMKYIYNFLNKYYDLGDEFTISMQSTLYSCGNCQRYMQCLQNLAIKDGKSIKIEFISDPEAITTGYLKQIIKNK